MKSLWMVEQRVQKRQEVMRERREGIIVYLEGETSLLLVSLKVEVG